VRNAKYACDESGRTDKLLTLRIEPLAAGARICVIDNGAGILAEHMPRLFTHGFTTRASGHGFGLHSAALAAQELGGSLRAMSEGPGCGATFILDLPANCADTRHG
jgi:signal transduction histidine kinase